MAEYVWGEKVSGNEPATAFLPKGNLAWAEKGEGWASVSEAELPAIPHSCKYLLNLEMLSSFCLRMSGVGELWSHKVIATIKF